MKQKRQRIQKLSSAEQSQLSRARQLLDAGRREEAISLCESISRDKARAPEPWQLLSWMYMQGSDFFPAQSAAEQAAGLEPANAISAAWAAEVCSEAGDLRAAKLHRAQVGRLGSRNTPVLASMAASLTAEERHTDALGYYRGLLKQAPGDTRARLNVAYSARYAGDFELAEGSLLDIIRDQPRFYQAHFALSQLRQATPESNHLELLEAAHRSYGDNVEGGAFLGYALGKEYEDIGEYARAFLHYEEGARCQRQLYPQPSREAEMANRMRALPEVGASSEPSDRGTGLIFVFGLPRTGTTLLDRMLGAHSGVRNGGELRAFPFVAHNQAGLRMGDVISPLLLERLGSLDFKLLGEAYLARLPEHWLSGRGLTDKNPVNYLYAGMIARALPAARIVHIRRSPMDACFSSFKQLFAPGAYRHSYRFEDLAKHYTAYRELMNFWRDTLGDNYLELSYEDLVRDTETQLRRVLSYCGLPWEDEVLDFHQRKSGVGTASFAQVRQPVYTSSVARWRRFESQLEPLAQSLSKAGVDPEGR